MKKLTALDCEEKLKRNQVDGDINLTFATLVCAELELHLREEMTAMEHDHIADIKRLSDAISDCMSVIDKTSGSIPIPHVVDGDGGELPEICFWGQQRLLGDVEHAGYNAGQK